MKPVYGVTDPALLPGERLYSGVAAALAGGVTLIQYRDKNAPAPLRRQRAERLNDLVQAVGGSLIINDDWRLAAAVGAAGVHLGQGDGDPAAARAGLPPGALIGVTCHADLSLAQQAVAAGASYVAFGRFFPSSTKPDAPAANPALLGRARASLSAPIVAIGGIDLHNLTQLVTAGAHSCAVCHSLFGAEDITAAARALTARFLQSHHSGQ